MVFSLRTIAPTFGGAIILFFLIIMAGFNIWQSLFFLAIYNTLVLGLILIDWLLTIKPKMLRLERKYEQRMSIGADNLVELTVQNLSGQDVRAVLKDDIPPEFEADRRYLKTLLPANQIITVKYTLRPHKRGDYAFGDINIRYYSRLGLFLRQFKVRTAVTAVRAYPNILEIRKYQLFNQKSDVISAGIKVSRLTGLGTDFESLRDYQPDDEFRRINWGATSRRGRLTSNLYEVDKSQYILLVIDAGRLMSGTFKNITMLDYAVNASLLLGYVGVNKDDKVGLLTFSDKVNLYLPPGKGRPQLQKILGHLYKLQPELVESDYQAACQYLSLKNRKRSLICFFTDLIDEEASRVLIEHVSVLAKNHLVLCIIFRDAGVVGKAELCPANSQEVYEKGIAREILRNRDKSVSILKSRGVTVLDVQPEEISIALVNKYLEMKSRLKL